MHLVVVRISFSTDLDFISIESYSKRDMEVWVAVINRVTQLDHFTSHRNLLQVMNTFFIDCMIPEQYEGDHCQDLIDRLRFFCEETFEQDCPEDSGSENTRGDPRQFPTSEQSDPASETKRRSLSQSSTAHGLPILPDGSTPSRPILVEEGNIEISAVTLGEDERVGGAFMFRYMRLLCDVYNEKNGTSVCITVDPNAWDQCKIEGRTGTITLPKNSVWPNTINTVHFDTSSISHLLIPIHDPLKKHWVLLHGFKDVELAKRLYVEYYDSLGKGLTASATGLVSAQLTWLRQFLGLGLSEEVLTLHQAPNQPIQCNGIDCGVIVMLVAKSKIMGHTIQGDPNTIQHMRRYCGDEINMSCLKI